MIRVTYSDQTKANLNAAKEIKLVPIDKTAITKYKVMLVGSTGKTVMLEDRANNTIIYKDIQSAKRQLISNNVPKEKIIIVSQLDI